MRKIIFCIFIYVFILIAVPGEIFAVSSYKQIRSSYNKSDSVLLDRNGIPLYELRTNYNIRRLGWASIKDISPALLIAVIFAEDRRFFEHSGIDYKSIASAAVKMPYVNRFRGASTITMQLASMLNEELHPGKKGRSISQKWQQMKEARVIEKEWSKKEILEAYLNLVSFRGEIQGIEAASRGFFGKAPHGLDHSESLILASLIRDPNAAIVEIKKRCLNLAGNINWTFFPEDIDHLLSGRFLKNSSLKPQSDLAPHIAAALFNRFPEMNVIKCTINAGMQDFIIQRMKHQLTSLKSRNVTNGCAIVADNKTGEVLAYVSCSMDPSRDSHVDGVRAKRQAGSTLKPFLYALAFENKILTPASLLEDSPIDIPAPTGIYRPHNYNATFNGAVSTRIALASSLNIPAVRALSLAGLEPFLTRLRKLGIQELEESGEYYGLSMALGSVDVSLWELTNAFRCLANGGIWNELSVIKAGNKKKSRRIFSPESVFLVSDILSDREARSLTFGLENPLSTRFWSAVKTGTSKDMRDNWCIGYSGKYTAGVWVGNFSGKSMWDVSGISGAAPVWSEIMNYLHRSERSSGLKYVPKNIVLREIHHRETGSVKKEWFIKGTEPADNILVTGNLNYKIIYPADGTIIALDPDIPADLQRVFFISSNQKKQRWILNDNILHNDNNAWNPEPGRYSLLLADETGNILDSVRFEVRGQEK